jgi:hypothetical protein
MSKRKDAQLDKLIRKVASATPKPKQELRRQYDDTLPSDEGKDPERERMFKEMKKREF